MHQRQTPTKKTTTHSSAPHGFRNERQLRLFMFKAVFAGLVALLVLHSYQISGTFFSEITGVLKTVFLSIFLWLLFVPFLNIMNKKGIPDWWGILLIYTTILSVFVLFLIAVFPILSGQFNDLADFIGEQLKVFNESDGEMFDKFASILPESLRNEELGIMKSLEQNFSNLGQTASSYISGAVDGLIDQIKGVTNVLVQIVLVLTFTFFFAIERHKMHDFFHNLIPFTTSKYIKKREKDMLHILFAWLRWQVILGFSIFISTYIGFWILRLFGIDIEQKFALAFIAGLTEFVPYLGPIIALIPAIFVALAAWWDATIGVIILYLLIQRLENNILVPFVMSKSLDMSAFTVLFVMLVGASLLGVVGIIIAIPLTSILSLFIRDWMQKRKAEERQLQAES